MPVAPREGIIAALWTLTDGAGQIMTAELKTNLAFIRSKGVHGLLVLGSTGEFVHLDLEARKRFLELVRGQTDSLPIIANISDVRPAAVAELGRFARQLGLGSVAVLPPWFFPLAQADLVEFFVRAGEAAELPLFLYNFPERTGNRIALETIAAVADRIPLAGVKQSGAEFEYHRQLAALGREKNFVVFSGGEVRLAEAMGMGIVGGVSGLANSVPEMVLDIYNAVKAGEVERANLATARMKQLVGLLSGVEFPLHVAATIEARNLFPGVPKTCVSSSTQASYDRMVADLRRLYLEWGLL